MHEITNMGDEVFKISGFSNMYILRDCGIVIDTGFIRERQSYEDAIKTLIPLEDIKIVLYTHLHLDHCGNAKLFKNASHYASEESISTFKENPFGTVLDRQAFLELQEVNLIPIGDFNHEAFKIVSTPGHTKGSICYLYKGKYLFSGDTLFYNGYVGRTDLPTSIPQKMDASLEILQNMKFEVLCPGHDYM